MTTAALTQTAAPIEEARAAPRPAARPVIEAVRHRYVRHIVAPMLRLIGPRAATALAMRLARGVHGQRTPARRLAEDRIRACFGNVVSTGEIDRLCAAMYEHWARFWIEALHIPKRLASRRWRAHVQIENEPAFDQLVDDRRGCIVTTGYFGNPAAAACSLGRLFKPIHVVVDHLTAPMLADWQRQLYSQHDVRPIDRRLALEQIPTILNNGGAVLIIGESERLHRGGVPVDYLGRSLRWQPTIARLARWYDANVAVVTCRREAAPMHFTLSCDDVIPPGAQSDAPVIRRIAAELEHAILAHPEQYLWSTPTRADFA